MKKGKQSLDPETEDSVSPFKCGFHKFLITHCLCRIKNTPMGSEGFVQVKRTGLSRSVITHRDHNIGNLVQFFPGFAV